MNKKKIYAHEILDDTVELGALVAKAKFGSILLRTSCQRTEILSGLGNSATVEAHGDTAHWFPAMLDIEIDDAGDCASHEDISVTTMKVGLATSVAIRTLRHLDWLGVSVGSDVHKPYCEQQTEEGGEAIDHEGDI